MASATSAAEVGRPTRRQAGSGPARQAEGSVEFKERAVRGPCAGLSATERGKRWMTFKEIGREALAAQRCWRRVVNCRSPL